jgi:cytochrome c-type biogenesis protein CcmH
VADPGPTPVATPAATATSAAVTSRGRRGRPRWLGVAVLAVVLAVALAIGSGVGGSGRVTDAQRAAALDTQVRCPSCEDLSVAQSSAPEAVAVRRQVARLVRAGRSDAQIEQVLVGEWGPTILLRPPDSGLTAVIWIAPVVLAAGAFGAVAVLFWRRSRDLARLREARLEEAPG